MAHSEMFEKAVGYYEQGFWSKKRLRMLVKKGALTKAEYTEITGDEY